MLKSIIFKIQVRKLKIYWKKINKHNKTTLGFISNSQAINFVRMNGIAVGKNTYGTINVNYTGNKKESLIIGNNCSLGRCNFLLGGEHEYKRISTYPYFNEPANTKGPILVQDDVWIGDSVWVLSGVTIGKGAVIGTGSVVTHNIPPYAIAVGNPAKVLKYRFSSNVIEKLNNLDIDFYELNNEKKQLFKLQIDDENIDDVIKKLKG